jgi:cation diffusion facilitator CzcD-associated flavoprotein CzcO
VSEELRKEFVDNPKRFHEFRKIIEVDGNTVHGGSFKGSPMQLEAQAFYRSVMQEKLAKKPEIMEALVPSFGVGCRRLTPGPGYLEALVEDNVDFVRDKIEAITPSGITLENGRKVDIDVLVCATGFNVSSPPPFYVAGKNGVSLQQKFLP